jgi:hypothetical protein
MGGQLRGDRITFPKGALLRDRLQPNILQGGSLALPLLDLDRFTGPLRR